MDLTLSLVVQSSLPGRKQYVYQPGRQPRQKLFSQVILPGPPWCSAATDVDDTECDNNNNNNITIYKAHNVRKELNLRRRQSLGGGKSNSV